MMRQDLQWSGGHQRSNSGGAGLVDVLDRVLDKGLVIAGDIKISLAEVELLTIRIRLIVCSLDKAEQVGLDWWKSDPHLHAFTHHEEPLEIENERLRKQIHGLERRMAQLTETAESTQAPAHNVRTTTTTSPEPRPRAQQPPRMTSGTLEDKRRDR